MDSQEVRLEILRIVVPQATRVGIVQPESIVKTCSHLENYVIGLTNAEEKPTPAPRKKATRPKKTTEKTPDFLAKRPRS
jgi:hypothetical protein